MKPGSPRTWMYSPNASPEPLPKVAWLHNMSSIFPISTDKDFTIGDANKEIDRERVTKWVGSHTIIGKKGESLGSIDEWLSNNSKTPMSERMMLIVPGELGNPYRLADIGITDLPIIPIRMDGICRTYTDVMDGREIQPGVHHITLARSKGWWEKTQLAFPDKNQARKMSEWINNGRGTNWLWQTLDEGIISIGNDLELESPSREMLEWDGEEEWIEKAAPSISGPLINLNDITVFLHTRQGIYNHRGRIARCVHYPQRAFHLELYRRGSATQWDAAINTK
ncbi:MAG: hypothetical protein HOC79_00565 [Euryarchaeota archaeon]|nr:hypothetical protein [Euryarchaeota archaeon]